MTPKILSISRTGDSVRVDAVVTLYHSSLDPQDEYEREVQVFALFQQPDWLPECETLEDVGETLSCHTDWTPIYF